ncbi:hypothetical protein DUNSADRAFT_4531 [Dunaliella salina]|uniref:Cyclic nucleotide-binding domain-containing protein n=1 Tax=Dunaliella salina TaxID=3046 RepID=A0ABQ7GRT5_DUNSA|nr:hypothetical protein DUNSADRAFT_4531 [Dunaliella salina]|eukprot:KAF5837323.1 hypothetical protein DUNSADRAFT_4531 [Dunaliella salina]
MQHLRMTLGPSQDIVTLSAHSPSKGASRGTKRKSTGRSKAFKAALLRRQAMQVPVEELANQQARQEGFGTVFEEGEEGEVSRSPSPKVGGNHEELEGEKSSDAGGSQSTQVPEGGAGPAEDIRESTSVRAPNSGGGFGHAVRAGGGAEDGAHADGEVPHASEHHSVHEQGVRVEAQEQAHGQEQGGQRNEQQQQQQQQQQGPPHVPEQEAEETQGHQGKHNKPFGHLKPPLHPHSVSRDPPAPQTLPSLRSKLSGTRTPSYNSSHQSTPTGAGGGSQRSSSQNDASSNSGSSRLASREAQNSRSGTPQRPYLLSGSGSGGRGAARPSQPVALVGAGLTAGKEIGKLHGHRRSSTHDGRVLPADGPGDGAHPAIHSSSSAADLGAAVRASATAPATPQHSGKVHEQDARSSGQAGELQSGEKGTLQSGGKITLHSAGKSTGAPEAQALKRQGTSGVSERHGGANREEQRSSAAGEHAGPSALQQQQQGSGGRGPVGDAEYPPTVASGTGDDESSESGAAVPEGLRGIPLLNALATMMKNHHQQVEAVFSQPVFMGTEALRASQDAPVHNSTMLCLQSTECILIPWAALAAVLPKASLALLSKRMQSQARTIATTAGPSQGAKIERWPECADILREFLQTKPGARPVWQAENLADGFSSVRALAQLPWQARLRLFQGLKFLVVEQADPALSLAIPTIQETAKPIAGINLNVPQLQGTAGSTGNDTDQAIQEGQEQGPGATPAEGEASAPAQREASTADIVQDTQKEDTKAEVEDGLVEEEQDTAGERKLRTTVTGALRGITASTAEADAAIARFQQQILQGNQFGNQDEQDKSPGAPTETTGEADGALHVSYAKEGEAPQTSDRTSGGSLHASSNPERAADTANANGSLQVCVPGGAQQSSDGTSRGKSVAGHISGKQGEAGPEQQQQAAHSVDAEEAEEGMPLYRSKSVLKAQLPPDDTRQLRSPESALSRLQAAAEAAELARLESEEATEIAHLDAVDAMGGGLGRGDQTVGYADSHAGGHANGQAGSFASFGGRSSEGVAPSVQQQQQQQQQQQEPRSVNWEEHKAQGNAKRSNASVSSLTASQRAKNVPETPDTDKFGSLKSWDGTASPDSHLLSPGPCTPPTQRPQGTSDPFPAAYHPYDMDAKVADRKPSADQPGKPPLPKAKSNRVEGQSLPSAGKPGPSLTEKPRIAPAALVDGPASETPPPFGTPHPPPPPPQNHTAALPPGEEASSAAIAPHNTLGQQGGADSSAPVLYVRRKVLVLDPNPEQKDDRHYIILSGSVELQAQPLSQEEMQAAIPPPAHQTALEQLAHRRRSAVRKQGLPPLVLATLGMGDAFNAKTAVELLRERMTAAYAPTAAAAEEGMEEGAGSGGAGAAASAGGSATSHGPHGPKQRQQQQQQQQQNAALPLPSGPCRIVAIVMSPRVELLAMNAVLFGLVVGGAGRPMAKLEVQDVLKQMGIKKCPRALGSKETCSSKWVIGNALKQVGQQKHAQASGLLERAQAGGSTEMCSSRWIDGNAHECVGQQKHAHAGGSIGMRSSKWVNGNMLKQVGHWKCTQAGGSLKICSSRWVKRVVQAGGSLQIMRHSSKSSSSSNYKCKCKCSKQRWAKTEGLDFCH